MKASSYSVLALLTAGTGLAAAAPVLNGGFESGDLAAWYSSGTAAIANGSAGYSALSGNHSALVVAVSTAPVPPYSCATDIWNVNCPQPLPFSASGAPLPTHTNYQFFGVGFAFYRGAFIGQDLTVTAGQKVEWDWLPFGEAVGGSFSVDEARFYATNGVIEQTIDFDANVRSFEFSQSGVWSIYFGLYQTEDPYIYSAIMVDSVRLVSEPPTLALAALCLLLAFGRKLRIGKA